ncbi:MAG: mechanosensitive ion channel family protein, partial [Trichormus sp.]
MNILIIFAEVIFVILIFLLFRWLVGTLAKLLIKFSIFQSNDIRLKILRRNITGFLLLACIISCIFIIGGNSFLLYRGENLQQYKLALIQRIPPGLWITIGTGIAQSIGTAILAAIAVKLVNYWLKVASTRAKNLEQNTADDESIDAFFNALNHRIRGGIWLWVIISCTQFLKLPAIFAEYLYIALRIYLIVAV